jgi:phosphatidyl-myo-inositol dimannoside synthase
MHAEDGNIRILALMSDAFGGYGGIAKFNRDLLTALAANNRVESIHSLSRLNAVDHITAPNELIESHCTGHPARYIFKALKFSRAFQPSVILCGHINLLPVAAIVKRWTRARLWFVMHGLEVWSRPVGMRYSSVRHIDVATAVSRHTRELFLSWAPVDQGNVRVLPNTIDPIKFSPGEKPAYLLDRYALHQRTVLLSVGRIAASERQKGHDRVIRLLPRLAEQIPDITFIIVGDGEDRPYLSGIAEVNGCASRVVYAGKIPDAEIVDHYRLADAFAMPSTQEGFGITFLEAAACGVPVVGGNTDGSWDALAEGRIGQCVDPDVPDQLCDGILRALQQEKRVPQELSRFSFANYSSHIDAILSHHLLAYR